MIASEKCVRPNCRGSICLRAQLCAIIKLTQCKNDQQHSVTTEILDAARLVVGIPEWHRFGRPIRDRLST
jgi:hypothetical protein